MDYFKENKCRKCRNVFCCKFCRLKHEEKTHGVNPSCNVCLYGKTYLRNIPESVLDHLKICHWPLHCVNCKRMFGSFKELILHNKCPMCKIEDRPIISPITPNVLLEGDFEHQSNFDSPPVMYPFGKNSSEYPFIAVNNYVLLTTSTPMHTEEEKDFFVKISQVITPVDSKENNLEKLSNKKFSELNMKTIEEPLKGQSTNWKVTFNENDMFAGCDKELNCSKEALKKFPPGKIETDCILSNTNSQYANTEKNSISIEKENIMNDEKSSSKVDATLWQSATSENPVNCKFLLDKLTSIESAQMLSNSKYLTTVLNTDVSMKTKVETTDHFECLNSNPSSSKNVGIWSSVANLVKSVVKSLSTGSFTSQNDCKGGSHSKFKSLKRSRVDSENYDDIRQLKKIKLTKVKCRRSINHTVPYKKPFSKRFLVCDKSTQTD